MEFDVKKLNAYLMDEVGDINLDKVIRLFNDVIDEVNVSINGVRKVVCVYENDTAATGYGFASKILSLPEGRWNKILNIVVDNVILYHREIDKIRQGYCGYFVHTETTIELGCEAAKIEIDGYEQIPKFSLSTTLNLPERLIKGMRDGLFANIYKTKDNYNKDLFLFYSNKFQEFLNEYDGNVGVMFPRRS